MKNGFFALVFRQQYIRRWGLMRNVKEENLAEHSAQTAMIAHALALIGNRRLGKSYDANAVAVCALYHDATEVYTGDLPTPVKYFDPEIRESYRKIEKKAVETLISGLPDDLSGEYAKLLDTADAQIHKLVKAADKLCAYLKCVEELKCGNADFSDAKETLYESMTGMGCEELDIFLKEFVPPFGATVDKLHL